MKKLPKKLALHRETLSLLADHRLERLVGGAPRTEGCTDGCTQYTCHNSCPSTPLSGALTCPNYTV